MKYLALIIAVAALAGCRSRSPYDITPAQAQAHVFKGGPPGQAHMFKGAPGSFFQHLPPGAVKHELVFKKGDRLPDGTIADSEKHFFRVEWK